MHVHSERAGIQHGARYSLAVQVYVPRLGSESRYLVEDRHHVLRFSAGVDDDGEHLYV